MNPELSVVIPIRNESPNIEALYVEMTEALERWGRSYEVLAIDDGSTDDSFDRLVRCQQRDPRWRIIRFRRNFGQTAAFSAGFRHARGRLIATADGDLQNDPRDLPDMIRRVEEGSDIVCGWRKDRKDPWLTRRLPSELANRLISWSTGVKLHDYGCSLKVFRAEVVKPLKLYGEMHRFLPAIASEMGVTIDEVVVNHRARRHGVSKYGLSRTFRVVLDLLTVKFLLSYSTRPLQMFGLIGVPMGLLGFLIAAYLSYERLFGHESIANRPLLLLGVLLIFSGIQLVTMGLLAEIMARTYHESQDKPIYVIREVRESSAAGPAPAFIERLSGQRTFSFRAGAGRTCCRASSSAIPMSRSRSPSTATTTARRPERCGAFSATAWGRRISARTLRAWRARRDRVRQPSSRRSTRGCRIPVRAKTALQALEGVAVAGGPQMRQRIDAVRRELESGRPFEFSDCAIGNLVFAGCYLLSRPPVQRRGRRLLRAARACRRAHRERHRRHERVSGRARARPRRARERG